MPFPSEASEAFGAQTPEIPQGDALVEMVSDHYCEMLAFYGDELGGRVARKHLGWYMDDACTNATLRRKILTERTPAEVLRLLPCAFDPEQQEEEAA